VHALDRLTIETGTSKA